MKTSEQLNSTGLLKTAQKCVADGKSTVDLPRTLDDFFTGGHWNKVPTATGKPFRSFCEFASASQPYGLGLGQYNGHITAAQAWALCSGHGKLRAELLKLAVDDVQPLAKNGTNQHSRGFDNVKPKTQGGEEPQMWKDWAAEQKVGRAHFPGYEQCNKYMRRRNDRELSKGRGEKGPERVPDLKGDARDKAGERGNPFSTAPEFRSWLAGGPDPDAELEQRRQWILSHVQELRGKQLACWCSLSAECHADVLAELANSHQP